MKRRLQHTEGAGWSGIPAGGRGGEEEFGMCRWECAGHMWAVGGGWNEGAEEDTPGGPIAAHCGSALAQAGCTRRIIEGEQGAEGVVWFEAMPSCALSRD